MDFCFSSSRWFFQTSLAVSTEAMASIFKNPGRYLKEQLGENFSGSQQHQDLMRWSWAHRENPEAKNMCSLWFSVPLLCQHDLEVSHVTFRKIVRAQNYHQIIMSGPPQTCKPVPVAPAERCFHQDTFRDGVGKGTGSLNTGVFFQ